MVKLTTSWANFIRHVFSHAKLPAKHGNELKLCEFVLDLPLTTKHDNRSFNLVAIAYNIEGSLKDSAISGSLYLTSDDGKCLIQTPLDKLFSQNFLADAYGVERLPTKYKFNVLNTFTGNNVKLTIDIQVDNLVIKIKE